MSDSSTHEIQPDPAPPSSSCNDATVDAPPDLSQEQVPPSASCSDATVDAPPELNSQSPSFNDVTVDLPGRAPDASLLTIDRQHTHPADDGGTDLVEGSFTLSDGSCQVSDRSRVLVANYEVLGVLGRGAVGVVYKAKQVGLNRLVALKMLLAGSHAGERELARFRIEAEAVARLRHPNIVQVYEVGEHNGLPFFSLEFVEGGSLHQKMGGKPLPPREAAEIAEALARAMHYAHQQNIIHRDLKPANVLLTLEGTPKITDFGLAKRLEESDESSRTRTGTLMGTPSYMSPEQAEGRTRDIGPLSDQYTLGAILYEMLTGRPPFLGATLLDTIQQVRTQEPVPPTQLQAKTPRDLEIICLKSLQKEPSKRYVHAGEMADDLHRFLFGEPIRARPVSNTERLWRWCRRNPGIASLYAAVAVLLLLVAVSGGVLGLRLVREQQAVARISDQAEQRLEEATKAISGGDVQRAKDLLQWSDPLLESAAGLNELHVRWEDLKDRVKVFEQFKGFLDKARFAYFYGSRKQKEEGREYCRQLLALYDYDALAQHLEPAAIGLPPLNDVQKQLFKEDAFSAFLVSSLIESELSRNTEPAQQQQAAQQALAWLNRADKILPGMRTLYVHRSGFLDILGQEEAGKTDFEKARSIQPDSALDHFWHGYAEEVRGDSYNRKGEAGKAREHYLKEIAEYAALLRQRPDYFWGHFNWAVAKVKLGNLEDALIGFTNCIRLQPDFPWPYNNRGTVHLRLRQLNHAIDDFSTALERSPEYIEARINRALAYLEKGSFDLALMDCNQSLQQDPINVQAYLHRAECCRRCKQFEQAVADYTRLLDLNVNKAEIYRKRAAVYQEMKRPDDALRDYEALLTVNPKSSWAYFKRGQLRVARGEYQQALADYTASISLQPNVLEPYHYRAVLYWLHLKDFDAAMNDWRQIIKMFPGNPDAYRFLGQIHLGRRQYNLALQEFEDALSRQPDYPNALWGQAQIYLWQGKFDMALAVINPLAEKLPSGYEETLNIRGDIYRSLGRLEEAAADYRRLIELRPDLSGALESYVSLALVHCMQGQPDKAGQWLDRLVLANPQSAAAYIHRGRFLRDQGHFEAAWKDSEQAACCDPASALPALLQASITAARGDPAAAVAAAERALTQGLKDNGQVLYSAVQVWSLASAAAARSGHMDLAHRYADRAAALLAQTLDKGFHDLNYPEHNRMIVDPALEAIRQHPQARDLIAHQPVKD